ncbi:glycosyltransferase [Exilibacterium tricleocarpae]|uniref:Glycosyltransferase n=1 Tax=Exilibacterium tricleocarpae TaxID=2591008 RepID=A0A545T3F5_9GAMM|nr:glycosyltransferase [Exilibacterium tricleocarpae]TQV71749.1 glycosyltransferase [Exilibacterium tricleocarpae]
MDISVIIPALNEAAIIGETLANVSRHMPQDYTCEIIVADNGSTDATVEIAKQQGASVVIDPGKTVAGLRNLAFRQATGSIIIFIDADVIVSKQWGEHLPSYYQRLQDEPKIVCGSRCLPRQDDNLYSTVWFSPLAQKGGENPGYIGTGHMITSRQLFLEVGGFREDLVTGEDYNFCQDAVQAGARILLAPQLQVFHEGFPGTAREFIARESWHGMGDFQSIASVLQSKVALMTGFFCLLHLTALICLLSGQLLLLLINILLILCIPIASSYIKFQQFSLADRAASIYINYLYFIGRTLSIVKALRQTLTGRESSKSRW